MPRPFSTARRYARCAAATSSTARPRDLKIVTSASAGSRGPGFSPVRPPRALRPLQSRHPIPSWPLRANRRTGANAGPAPGPFRTGWAALPQPKSRARQSFTHSFRITGSGDEVTSTITSAPRPPLRPSPSCARRSVVKMLPDSPVSGSTRGLRRTGRRARALQSDCAPARPIRESPAPANLARASFFTETAETAAVRASVI